jgi:hypothetical protein
MTHKELSHSLKESLSSSSVKAIKVIEQYEEEYPYLSEQAEITLKVKDLKKALQVAQRDWPYVVANRRAKTHDGTTPSKSNVTAETWRAAIDKLMKANPGMTRQAALVRLSRVETGGFFNRPSFP